MSMLRDSAEVAAVLKRVVAKRAVEERGRRAMDRACFFPITDEAQELIRIRINLMEQDIDIFSAVAAPRDYDAQRRIAQSTKWGLEHLKDARGAWPNDPTDDDLVQRCKNRREKAAPESLVGCSSRRVLAGPGPPGQGIRDEGRQLTLNEIMSSGQVWDDELSRRVAKLSTMELAVSPLSWLPAWGVHVGLLGLE